MSNKTPKAKDAKTGWGPKVRRTLKSWQKTPITRKQIVIQLGVAIVMAVLIVFAWYDSTRVKMVHWNGKGLTLEVVDTPAKRELGLSKRPSLATNKGMLFTFDSPDLYCFWMKDMRFPLDMIWLSSDKKVVFIKDNVDPSTYPIPFCPTKAAQYVVELNAGKVAQMNISIGERLNF